MRFVSILVLPDRAPHLDSNNPNYLRLATERKERNGRNPGCSCPGSGDLDRWWALEIAQRGQELINAEQAPFLPGRAAEEPMRLVVGRLALPGVDETLLGR